MTSPGNHEIQSGEADSSSLYFAQYRNRFTMPRAMGSGSTDGSDTDEGMDMWHSYNLGGIHFISYSSEVFFSATDETQSRMVQWLTVDLAAANTAEARAAQPWVVAYAHRPMYCSNVDGDDCTKVDSVVRLALEDLMYENKVDLIFEAHEHSCTSSRVTISPVAAA